MHPTFGDPRLPERFWSKIKVNEQTGCWEWQAALFRQRRDYAAYRDGSRTDSGHRVAYRALVGPIPEDLQLDHLCRLPRCVRPDHLEPVTLRENVRRSSSMSAVAARTGECPRGHSLDDAYINPSGRQQCRPCKRMRERAAYARGGRRRKADHG